MSKKLSKAIEGQTLTITFGDESQITANLGDFSEAIQLQLAMHGLSQKLGDSASGIKDLDEAKEKVSIVLENLKEGKFIARTGGGAPRTTLLARAIARMQNAEVEAITEVLNGLEDEQRKQLQKAPEVQAVIAEIKAEDAKAKLEKDGGTSVLSDLFGG